MIIAPTNPPIIKLITLTELKVTKKEFEAQIHQQRLSELDELIQEKGLSFDEIKTMLNKAE